MTEKQLIHLGIIPDGARRWARANQVTYYEAYWGAMLKLLDVLEICFEFGVLIQSVYLLSKENLRRMESDLEPVYQTEERLIREFLPDFCSRWNCCVIIAGVTNILPKSYVGALDDLVSLNCERTKKSRKLYLLTGYNPWDELENAIFRSKYSEEIKDNLWVADNVDLIIRTGDVELLSNFLPLQSGYAELCFIPKLFNDITNNDIIDRLVSFPKSGKRLMGQ
jgi:undecaprenyl diphosphate synthase